MKVTKKQLFIMYFTMLLLILLSNIFGYSTINYKPKYGITTANVNFRKTANLNKSSIIKVVKRNSQVKIVGEISDFYIVQLTNNQVGLLYKKYIRLNNTSLKNAYTYENFSKYFATINGSNTNIRGGPSTSFQKITKLQKGNTVEVIGRINNFNMIVTSSNTVGMIRNDLITKTTNKTNNTTSNITTNTQTTSNITTILNLINNARTKQGLSKLKLNSAITNIAQIKAEDMVLNNYFSHTSKKYKGPFEMMQSFGISYKSAGENIAGNPNIQNAVNSWINSSTHKQNIYNSKFNNIGIGIKKSNTYGYIIVAMFTEI